VLDRGAGIPPVERLAYLAELVEMQLSGVRHLVLAGAKAPVSFFAYPGKPSYLVPDDCVVHELAGPADDVEAALDRLAGELGAPAAPQDRPAPFPPGRPSGELTAQKAAEVIGVLLPEGAIVSDEGNTAGIYLAGSTAGSPPHQWMCLTGGSIGQGIPLATGAAIGAPGHQIVSVEADGSAMYTLQALWTQAREGLDVTTVILDNGAYAILEMELDRVGAEPPGPLAKDMLDLGHPALDFVALAKGMGVPSTRVTTAEQLLADLERALTEPGPHLIQAMVGRRL
jgi:acetolactate synthase-1/2/3 large subunit